MIPQANTYLLSCLMMRNPPLSGVPIYVLFVCLLAAVCGWAQCNPGDPVGRFDGSATSSQAGKLDISLNLLCESGHYTGTLNTPVGLYTVIAGSFDAGHLRLQFVQNGVSNVIIDVMSARDNLEGAFTSGDDKGPVSLRRSGEALPLTTGENRAILTPQQWREDLAYFTKELPKRHANAFAYTSKERFESAAAQVERKIDQLNSDEVYIELD